MVASVEKIPNKRVVYTFNEKGGVGKTTCARGLLDVYRKYKINCLAFDADERSAQLHRYYGNNSHQVKKINIFKIGKYDALLDDLDVHKPDVALVDLPGTSGEAFEEMEKELALFKQVKELGYQLTMVTVMSRTKDCIDALKKLMTYCEGRGEELDYLVVLNLFFGEKEKFTRWQNSETKTIFEGKGGIEITMPDLYEEMYDFIDEKSLTFSDAASAKEMTLSNRSRVFRWLDEFEKELQKAASVLGLESALKHQHSVAS